MSSPYDKPTKEIARHPAERSVPRTQDDLDFGGSGVGGRPTEPIPVDRRDADGRSGDTPTEIIERGPMGAAPNPVPATEAAVSDVRARRGTLDLGLLILRLAVGGTAIVHGLQKLTGWWNGPGLGGFENTLVEAGYEQARLLAILGAVGEVAGGALLVVGLLTPFAAAAVLAVMINAWCFRQAMEPGLQYFAPNGIEYETLLGITAAVIILTGPGLLSLDGRRGWATRPFVGSFVVLLIGVAAGICIWLLLNGANPML